jgi:hypothetical protein
MPGKPVGTPSVQPVGSQLPTVGTHLPKVGEPLKNGKLPNSPFVGEGWPTPDPNLIVAPYPTLNPNSNTFWDRLYQRWLHLFTDNPKPATGYFPSLTRRARERREREQELALRRLRD